MKNNFLKKYSHYYKLATLVISALLAVCLTATMSIAALPKKAYAYNTVQTHTWQATMTGSINTDGSFNGTENRIIDITDFVKKAKTYTGTIDANEVNNIKNENMNPLVWNFRGMDEDVTINVSALRYNLLTETNTVVGQPQTLNNVNFDTKYDGNTSPANQAYTYNRDKNQILAYLYVLNQDSLTSSQAAAVMASLTGSADPNTWTCNRIGLTISYTMTKAVIIYKDVADFTWIFNTDSWLMDTYNVNVMINIPVGKESVNSVFDKLKTDTSQELGAMTVSQNIYAWGHGSANGVVNLDASGVVTLKNDIVPGRTNAELRVAFPSAWLTNLNTNSQLEYSNQSHLSQILKEESVWHDSRAKNANQLLIMLVMVGICLTLILALLIFQSLYRRRLQTQELEAKNIMNLHPCTILRIKNWNRPNSSDITESILYLEDLGIIDIEFGLDGCYSLTLKDSGLLNINNAAGKIDDIDANTIEFIFGKIGKGKTTVSFDEIYTFANSRSKSFIDAYHEWSNFLKEKTRQLAGFKVHHKRIRRAIYVVSICLLILGCGLAIFSGFVWTAIVAAFGALVMAYVANSMRNKLVIVGANDEKIDISSITMLINPEQKQTSDFKAACDKVLDKSLRVAENNVQFYN